MSNPDEQPTLGTQSEKVNGELHSTVENENGQTVPAGTSKSPRSTIPHRPEASRCCMLDPHKFKVRKAKDFFKRIERENLVISDRLTSIYNREYSIQEYGLPVESRKAAKSLNPFKRAKRKNKNSVINNVEYEQFNISNEEREATVKKTVSKIIKGLDKRQELKTPFVNKFLLVRKKEYDRIRVENSFMLQRLIETKPVVQREEQKAAYKRFRELSQRISRWADSSPRGNNHSFDVLNESHHKNKSFAADELPSRKKILPPIQHPSSKKNQAVKGYTDMTHPIQSQEKKNSNSLPNKTSAPSDNIVDMYYNMKVNVKPSKH